MNGVEPGLVPRPGRRLALRSLRVAGCLLVLASPSVRAKEADSFTDRYEALAFPAGEVRGRPVHDFTDEFDGEVQRIFGDVLDELNEENRRAGESCFSTRAPRRLFHKLSNALGGPVVVTRNRLRPVINRQPNHFKTELSSSIYQDFTPWQSISLGLLSKFGDKMAEVLRFDLEQVLVEGEGAIVVAADGRLTVLGPDGRRAGAAFRLREAEPAIVTHGQKTYYLLDNGQALVESPEAIHRLIPILVSSDKFSHFFNRGLGLFKRLGSGSEEELDRALAYNYRSEASLWGSRSTGVAAYGDLVANFQGMRFWIHLLGESLDGYPVADPLGAPAPAPYVRCSAEGRWLQTRRLEIQDYLDPAWDEALNCSRLRSRALLEKVSTRIEDLGRRDARGRVYDCPVDAELIGETAESYGRFAPRVINSDGHSSLRPGSAD